MSAVVNEGGRGQAWAGGVTLTPAFSLWHIFMLEMESLLIPTAAWAGSQDPVLSI